MERASVGSAVSAVVAVTPPGLAVVALTPPALAVVAPVVTAAAAVVAEVLPTGTAEKLVTVLEDEMDVLSEPVIPRAAELPVFVNAAEDLSRLDVTTPDEVLAETESPGVAVDAE